MLGFFRCFKQWQWAGGVAGRTECRRCVGDRDGGMESGCMEVRWVVWCSIEG